MPLTPVEQALVRALVSAIVRELGQFDITPKPPPTSQAIDNMLGWLAKQYAEPDCKEQPKSNKNNAIQERPKRQSKRSKGGRAK